MTEPDRGVPASIYQMNSRFHVLPQFACILDAAAQVGEITSTAVEM